MMRALYILLLSFYLSTLQAKVELGADLLFEEPYVTLLKNRKIGLITNQTGINSHLISTAELLQKQNKNWTLVALFAPEHGHLGHISAGKEVDHKTSSIPIYSLHGKTRRPTDSMLKNIDTLIFDIQDIGSRSYTYISTLFYCMEEAAKRKILVIVLDRPNPMGGIMVDGPMLEDSKRSFIGYIHTPYCHGMTIGELARYFNGEYKIGCKLEVVPMRGWRRTMSFKDTHLSWIPTSPYIPEADTPYFYASTGLIGELGIVNIGIGYTLPFKVIGAPWIRAEELARELNAQKLPGVKFLPITYRPFYGLFKEKECKGVRIMITNPMQYRPIAVQYLLLGMLKSLYPKEVGKKLAHLSTEAKTKFCNANGNETILNLLIQEKYSAWKMISYQESERASFLEKRKKYLLYY